MVAKMGVLHMLDRARFQGEFIAGDLDGQEKGSLGRVVGDTCRPPQHEEPKNLGRGGISTALGPASASTRLHSQAKSRLTIPRGFGTFYVRSS